MCADTELSKYVQYMFSFPLFFNQPNPIPLPFTDSIHRVYFYIHAAKRRAETGQSKHPGSARPRFEPRTAHISIFSSYPEAPQLHYRSNLVARFSRARRFRRTAGRALRAGMAEDVRRWCIWRCRVVNWSLAIVLSRGYEHSFGQLVQ